jgi:hypothetical protein
MVTRYGFVNHRQFRGELGEPELSEGGDDPACVCRRGCDEYVEILRRAWPAVGRECVSADEQEPDPMALQGAQKLGPVGRELHRRKSPRSHAG